MDTADMDMVRAEAAKATRAEREKFDAMMKWARSGKGGTEKVLITPGLAALLLLHSEGSKH